MSEVERESHSSRDHTDCLCDFCDESKALLYCRADSAKLCFSCDREVHSTNQLFKKHNRSLLCNSCNSSPSSIFCRTESAVFCQNCDWEVHQHSGSIHDRLPVEWFSGCPSVSELLGFLGLEDSGKKSLDLVGGNDEGLLNLLVWETPSFVSLDDLIVTNDGNDSAPIFQAIGVPPLPKNRNASCGKHKEEILSQLQKMAKKDPDFSSSLEDLEPQVPAKCVRGGCPGCKNRAEPVTVPSYEACNAEWCFSGDEAFRPRALCDLSEMSHLVPDKDSEAANAFQEIQSRVPVTFKLARELNSQERDSAISRYKEKKKTRRYDRQVRYESRKVRAERRVRIKGRFAKMDVLCNCSHAC